MAVFTCRINRDYSVVRCEQTRFRWHGSNLVLKYHTTACITHVLKWYVVGVWSALLTIGLGVAAGSRLHCTGQHTRHR